MASASGDLPAGISQLDKASFVYKPQLGVGAKPAVLVLFHGAGGEARRFLGFFREEADRRGMILLSVQSLGASWDIVGSADSYNVGRVRSAVTTGRDAKRVDEALAALFGRVNVDPGHILAVGFSDGASYALSLVLSNGQLFRGAVGLSPGLVKYAHPGRSLRIAIAHGAQDQVLPFDNARRMADELKRRGQQVSFLPFDGGHAIELGSLGRALDFALRPQERGSPPL